MQARGWGLQAPPSPTRFSSAEDSRYAKGGLCTGPWKATGLDHFSNPFLSQTLGAHICRAEICFSEMLASRFLALSYGPYADS